MDEKNMKDGSCLLEYPKYFDKERKEKLLGLSEFMSVIVFKFCGEQGMVWCGHNIWLRVAEDQANE